MPSSRTSAAQLASLPQLISAAEAAALGGTALHVWPAEMRRLLSPHYSAEEIEAVVVPARTLQRRLARGEKLTAEESDRAVRLARIADHAERVFGAQEKAGRWLRRPNAGFDGAPPFALLRSETGARKVEEALLRIDHGIFA
ncbi:MAG: DUF2384 domain-containing protein [Hyphomicrobiales bacterium]|nr:DUF2384 domain-containing protein [Hyphomicrobiales bacterium]